MCHSMHQAFRYTLINQCEFLDNSGEGEGEKFYPQKRMHSILWEKNLLVIIKQLQSKPYQGQSFANWIQAAPRADGTDAMTNSSTTIIFLGLAVYLTTTSVWGVLYTGCSRSRQPNTYSFTFIFKSEVEFASYVLRVAALWTCNTL